MKAFGVVSNLRKALAGLNAIEYQQTFLARKEAALKFGEACRQWKITTTSGS